MLGRLGVGGQLEGAGSDGMCVSCVLDPEVRRMQMSRDALWGGLPGLCQTFEKTGARAGRWMLG